MNSYKEGHNVEITIGSRKSEVGSRKSEVGSRKSLLSVFRLKGPSRAMDNTADTQ